MAAFGDTGKLVGRELVIERVFNAPRALVFRAWTDPEHARQWFGPRDYPARELTMDVRPGGRWRSCLRSVETGNDLWVGGVYREIVAPERLVFTFAWEEEGERGLETLVTLTFTERDGHRGGWTSTWDRLDDLLAA